MEGTKKVTDSDGRQGETEKQAGRQTERMSLGHHDHLVGEIGGGGRRRGRWRTHKKKSGKSIFGNLTKCGGEENQLWGERTRWTES